MGKKGLKKKSIKKERPSHSLLNNQELSELKLALKEVPPDKGIWTGPKVAEWIAKKTGKEKVWLQRGWDYLKQCCYSIQRPRPRHKKGDKVAQEEFKTQLTERVKELSKEFPNKQIEVWSFDEHRLGLKPIMRKVWAPIGSKPEAVVNHRYEWVYLYGFVHPQTGKTEWFIIPRVNVEWFSLVLEEFAKQTEAGKEKVILLVMDRAGWHMSKKVIVPEGIYLEPLPPYSPELQPAERLWSLADEPLVNKTFETLDDLEEVLSERCQILSEMTDYISNLTYYHWWPEPSTRLTG